MIKARLKSDNRIIYILKESKYNWVDGKGKLYNEKELDFLNLKIE